MTKIHDSIASARELCDVLHVWRYMYWPLRRVCIGLCIVLDSMIVEPRPVEKDVSSWHTDHVTYHSVVIQSTNGKVDPCLMLDNMLLMVAQLEDLIWIGLPLRVQVELFNHLGGHNVLCTHSNDIEGTKLLWPCFSHLGHEDACMLPILFSRLLLLHMHDSLNVEGHATVMAFEWNYWQLIINLEIKVELVIFIL